MRSSRLSPHVRRQIRESLWSDADGTCAVCGRFVELPACDLGHIIPIVAGGSNELDNFRIECRKCNRSEGARISSAIKSGNRTAKVNEESVTKEAYKTAPVELGGLAWEPPLLSLGHDAEPCSQHDQTVAEQAICLAGDEQFVPPLFATPITPKAVTRLADFEALAAEMVLKDGSILELMAWQRWILRLGTEQQSNGNPVHRSVLMSVARQQGKTTLLQLVVVDTLLRFAEVGKKAVILWIGSDQGQTITVFRDSILPIWEATGLDYKLKAGTQSPRVETEYGVVHIKGGQSKLSGVGSTVDLVVLDECWSLDKDVEAAVTPTIRTRPQAQIWAASSYAPATTPWWLDRTAAGRRESDTCRIDRRSGRFAYTEWGPEPGADIHVEPTWLAALPAVDDRRGGVSLNVLRHEHADTSLEAWTHASLNGRPIAGGNPAISTADWAACLEDFAAYDYDNVIEWLAAEGHGVISLGVDAPPVEHGGAQLAVIVGTAGVRACVLCVADGTGWIADYVRNVAERVVIERVATLRYGACHPALEDVTELPVTFVDTAGYGAGCINLHEEIKAGSLEIVDGDGVLTSAAHTAVGRRLRTATGWGYYRSHKAGEPITALMALVLARHAAANNDAPVRGWIVDTSPQSPGAIDISYNRSLVI